MGTPARILCASGKDNVSMSPIMITYIGFFVAALILAWAIIEMSRRFYRHKKIDAQVMNTWVPLQLPSSETERDALDETSRSNKHSRAQQNGHYSESKK